MSRKNKPPRIVQDITGWSYTRSLRFVQENDGAMRGFAFEEGISHADAWRRMATAELELDDTHGGNHG